MSSFKKDMNNQIWIVAILFIVVTLYINIHKDILVTMNRPLSTFPTQVGNWRMSGESLMSEGVLEKLRPTDYLSRTYIKDGKKVNFYLGYHGGGNDSGELHSPKHCLPGSGWYESHSEKMKIKVAGTNVSLVSSVYQKGEARELFLYWFQVKDQTLNNEYSLKVAQILNSIFSRRRDASFIRISVPIQVDELNASQTGVAFIMEFFPIIREYLPS